MATAESFSESGEYLWSMAKGGRVVASTVFTISSVGFCLSLVVSLCQFNHKLVLHTGLFGFASYSSCRVAFFPALFFILPLYLWSFTKTLYLYFILLFIPLAFSLFSPFFFASNFLSAIISILFTSLYPHTFMPTVCVYVLVFHPRG